MLLLQPSIILKEERCLSGRKERFAKSSYGLNCTVGSNPTLSANLFYIRGSSGRSVARSSRHIWDVEVASSNLAAPTTFIKAVFFRRLFYFDHRVPMRIGKVASSNLAAPTTIIKAVFFRRLFYFDHRVPMRIGKVASSNLAAPTTFIKAVFFRRLFYFDHRVPMRIGKVAS